MSIAFALVTAVLYGVASVLQHGAAQQEEIGDRGALHLSLRLLRRPRWLLGKAADFGAIATMAVALAHGSFIVVQSIVASGVVVALVLEALGRRRAPAARALAGATVLVVGAVVLVGVGRPGDGLASASLARWLVVGGATAAAIGAAVAVAERGHVRDGRRWRPALLAAGAGTCFALDAACLKSAAHALDTGGSGLVAVASVAGFGAAAVVGNVLVQRAFHLSALTVALPILTAAEPVAAVALGIALFAEQLHAGVGSHVGGFAGVIALTAGCLWCATAVDEAVVGAGAPQGGPPGAPPGAAAGASVTR